MLAGGAMEEGTWFAGGTFGFVSAFEMLGAVFGFVGAGMVMVPELVATCRVTISKKSH